MSKLYYTVISPVFASQHPYVTLSLPGLSAATPSASADLPEAPAAISVVLLVVVPGVISVLSVPTSLTQNYTNSHIHKHTHTYMH